MLGGQESKRQGESDHEASQFSLSPQWGCLIRSCSSYFSSEKSLTWDWGKQQHPERMRQPRDRISLFRGNNFTGWLDFFPGSCFVTLQLHLSLLCRTWEKYVPADMVVTFQHSSSRWKMIVFAVLSFLSVVAKGSPTMTRASKVKRDNIFATSLGERNTHFVSCQKTIHGS